MPSRRRTAGLCALVFAGGCALRAHDHPCYPYLADHYHGNVPPDVMRVLAHDGGAKRTIARQRAPLGFYWRRATPGTGNLEDIRTVADGHELVACPGHPQ
jgi:hypothetical protein